MVQKESEQLGPRAESQLAIEMLAVILHRAAANPELHGNRLRIQPLQQQRRHLPLTPGEPIPPNTRHRLLHRDLEAGAIWQCRALGQQRLALPPLLTTERMHQREQLLQPRQLVTAEGTALVEPPQKQHQRQPVPHRQDQPHLLLPAGGLIEVVAIFGIEPPLGDLRQRPDASRQALFQRLHKGILTEVAGEVAVKQQSPLMVEVVVEVDGALPHP